MAASGCLDEERSEALAENAALRTKSVLLDMMLPERIYKRTEFDFVRSGPPSGGASGGKCLVERLGAAVVMNKVVVGSGVASSSSSPALGLVGSRDGYQPATEFTTERRNHRYDRAASTDSVATSSGESCRSSSDSASSAPCSPESVLSDSGGAEGLPDSVASLVSGDLGDLGDATPDSGFNLSRLLLPQQHRQGESAADARKRDLRLVDEVVAAATASASDSCCPAGSPASPRPQSSVLAAATTAALSFSSALASSLSSSSSSATTAVTSTAAAPFLTTCSTSTVAASLAVPPASLSSSVTSSSVPVSSSSCSGPTVSHAELCATVAPPACRQASPLTSSQKCAAQVASPSPHPAGCAKSRRKRKLSGDARKRDATAVSDEEPEDEDICRRREAEVESLLRHCVDLVAERLDPQRKASTSISTAASSNSSCTSPLRNHREQQHQPELRRHHETHHQAATTSSSPRNTHRHQDHRQQRESRHQERHAHEDCEDAGRSQERRNHVLEHRTGHHHHHSLPNHTSQPNHNSQQQNHKKQHHLRQAESEASLPPPSPDCSSSSSSSRSIPDEEESGCILETETTSNAETSAAALSIAVSPTSAPPVAASPTIGSSTGVSPAKVSSTAAVPSTSSAAAGSSSTPCASSCSPASFAAAPSPCSSTQSSVLVGEDGLCSCRWLDCEMRLRSEEALGDHVRAAHVDTQTRDQGLYACRWQGCKVFERRSCSRQWLERHVTQSHCGSRPFPCIVAGCGQRFGSQGALQRHVNAHFERSLNGSGPIPLGGGAGSSGSGSGVTSGGSLLGSRGFGSKELANGDSPLKLLRLRKKLKCRRRAWATAKHADFFDAGIMEELRHRLADVSAPESPTEPHSWNGSTVTFHGTVVARRKENTGKVKVLLHWVPEHVLPDSWVSENQSTEKVVALSSLSADDLHVLNLWPKDLPSPCQESSCEGSSFAGGRRRKRK